MKEVVSKHKRDIQTLEAETQGQRQADENKEERSKAKNKMIADRWSNIHKEKLVQVG